MAFGGYSGTRNFTATDQPLATGPSSSLAFGSTTNQTSITKKTAFSLGSGLGAVNQVSTNVLTMASSGSATLNLQSLTNMLGVTAVVLLRLKSFIFWLLSTLDDTIAGTLCTSVTVGAAGTNPNLLNMGGTTPTFTLKGGGSTGNGDWQEYTTSLAAGITVSGTALNVLVTNNDASHSAAVYYNLAGADV